TGLFSLASGAGAKGVLAGLMPMWIVIADAAALIVFSIFCFCAAVWRFNRSGATRHERVSVAGLIGGAVGRSGRVKCVAWAKLPGAQRAFSPAGPSSAARAPRI